MFGLGIGELVIILVIVLILFGPGRLPDLGGALGEGIKNFRKGFRDSKALDVTPPDSSPTNAGGSSQNTDGRPPSGSTGGSSGGAS